LLAAIATGTLPSSSVISRLSMFAARWEKENKATAAKVKLAKRHSNRIEFLNVESDVTKAKYNHHLFYVPNSALIAAYIYTRSFAIETRAFHHI